jgi:GNAT superfamily N-acetyltransferase
MVWLVTAELETRPESACAAPEAGDPSAPEGPASAGVVVGECAVKGPLVPGAAAEIGYGLAPGVRGRGYGRRMLGELVARVVAAGASEIRAQTSTGNAASRRLLERAGFQLGPAGPDATTVSFVLPASALHAPGPTGSATPRVSHPPGQPPPSRSPTGQPPGPGSREKTRP